MINLKNGIWVTCIVVSIVLVLFAVHVFPMPGTDSVVFIPPALLYAQGYGLANPLYHITLHTDLTHTFRFNYYVPFFSFVLGLMSRVKPDVKTIFLICSFFSVANLLLYAKVVSASIRKPISLVMKIAILASVTYVATYLLPTVGRPENFTCLFVFLIYLLYHKRDEINPLAYYVSIALLFSFILSSQIVCFYFCFLFYVLYNIVNADKVYRAILNNMVLFLLVMGLFCGILWLSPNGLVNTINGIIAHSKFVLTRSDNSLSLLVHYWVLAPLNFGFIGIFLLAVICFAKELSGRAKNMEVVKKVVIVLLLLAIAIGIVKLILYAAPTVYNATQFILPLLAYILHSIFVADMGILRKGMTVVLLVTCLAGSLIFFRYIVLFADTLHYGKDYDSAKIALQDYTNKYKRVNVPNFMWTLFDDIHDFKPYEMYNFKPGDTIIIQQAYQAFPVPAGVPYDILYDWRSPEPIKFMGIKIANRPHGYGFVVCAIK